MTTAGILEKEMPKTTNGISSFLPVVLTLTFNLETKSRHSDLGM